MKTILFILTFTGITFSQWTSLNTGTNSHFFCMSFINTQTGWVAGENGKVIFTSNSGNDWITVSGNTNSDRFECIQFIDLLTGWAGSYSGKIYKTSNGGYNWTYVSLYYSQRIRKLQMLNSLTGYCSGVDAPLRKTTDGGMTWMSPGSSVDGLGLYFLNTNTGFLSKFGTIYRTTNGGSVFDLVYSTGSYFALADISFIDQNTGYVMGHYRYTVRTTNMGSNWFRISYDSSSPPFDLIYSVSFIDNNLGYACGQSIFPGPITYFYPIFRKTTNGGLNWSSVTPPESVYSLEDIIITDGQTGFLTGYQGKVFRSINAGYVGISKENNHIPDRYKLFQNYPNPFNPNTKIRVDIPVFTSHTSQITIVIYSSLGQLVQTLINKTLSPGSYEFAWNASVYPCGVYFYRLSSADFSETKRMVLLK